MRCDEIQEQLVDLLYDGELSPNPELQEHLRTCSACRQEFEGLRQTRDCLHQWKDESPLRSISVARQESFLQKRSSWTYFRYAAVAAMVLFCFLALANTEITWNNAGFSLRTSLFKPTPPSERDYYTKSEVRNLMKRALDDSENRTNEASYLLMQKVLDTVERDPWMMRLVHSKTTRNENRN